MSDVREALILCEGFDDRAFWQGLLLALGCETARAADSPHQYQASYKYRSLDGRLLQVVPCNAQRDLQREMRDRDAVRRYAQTVIKARTTKPVSYVVVNVDVDDSTEADVLQSIRSLVGSEARETAAGDFELDGGAMIVSPLLWNVPDPVADGVPGQQSLERLVCSAICNVYPARGKSIQQWLSARPDPRGKEHKAHAWSFMAGWHTDHGMGDFYSSLWRDSGIRRQLEAILTQHGTWRIVRALVGTSDPTPAPAM